MGRPEGARCGCEKARETPGFCPPCLVQCFMHRRPQSQCSLAEWKGRGWRKGNPCRKPSGSVYQERPGEGYRIGGGMQGVAVEEFLRILGGVHCADMLGILLWKELKPFQRKGMKGFP